MGATVVLLCVSRDGQQDHCRTHHAVRKRHYVFKKHMSSHFEPLNATLRFPKATVEPLKATVEPLKATVEPLSSHSEKPQKATASNCEPLESFEKPQKGTASHSELVKSHVLF